MLMLLSNPSQFKQDKKEPRLKRDCNLHKNTVLKNVCVITSAEVCITNQVCHNDKRPFGPTTQRSTF